jgi:hypothetical protein
MSINIDNFFDFHVPSESTNDSVEDFDQYFFCETKIEAPETKEYNFERTLIYEDPSYMPQPKYQLRSRGKADALVKKPLQKEQIGGRSQSGVCESLGNDHEHSTKNIVKNYGNAIIGFGITKVALPYIQDKAEEYGVNVAEFQKFMSTKKDSISGIDSLRSFLMESNKDTEQTRGFKAMFKHLAVVFIKYFSVNWIFNSKIKYKEAHLKFRNRMLRRIMDPEHFTYLKS